MTFNKKLMMTNLAALKLIANFVMYLFGSKINQANHHIKEAILAKQKMEKIRKIIFAHKDSE